MYAWAIVMACLLGRKTIDAAPVSRPTLLIALNPRTSVHGRRPLIAQPENMVQADPTNDMAHYPGKRLPIAQAGRYRDAAAESYVPLLPHQQGHVRPTQLAGAEFIACNDKPLATEV